MSFASVAPWIGYVVTGLAASAGTIAATLWTSLGDRLVASHFDKALETHKSDLGREVEQLKARLHHFTDRGVRANQLEYEAVTAAWTQYVKAHNSTHRAIIRFSSRPDLDAMQEPELDRWLATTDFSEAQKEQVKGATDKNGMYGKIESLRYINVAGTEIFDTHAILGDKGIFIPADLESDFLSALDKCSKGWAAEKTKFSMPPHAHDENLNAMIHEFIEHQAEIKDDLKQKVRNRILAAYPD